MLGWLTTAILALCVAWSMDKASGIEITPANCRSNTEACLNYACNKMRSSYSRACSDNDYRETLRRRLKNCFAPKVDLCLKDIPAPQNNRWGSSSAAVTPANCRSNPESCMDYACRLVEQTNRNACDNQANKQAVRNRLKNCYAPNVDSCLRNVPIRSTNRRDWTTNITPANCRADAESCMVYACNYIERSNSRGCNDWTTKEAVRRRLQNCFAPKVDLCLNDMPSTSQSTWSNNGWGNNNNGWSNSNSNNAWSDSNSITPANCRSNPDSCMNYACQRVPGGNTGNCNREAVRRRLTSCFAPTVDICIRDMPAQSTSITISPSICRANAESCMPYACEKVRKDYGRYCSDSRFRSDLKNLIMSCYSISVDICLADVPDKIGVNGK